MSHPTHAMLTRQLKRYLGNAAAVPSEWMPLIQAVNEAYREFDQDRGMLERSLELSSEELIQANADLRESQMRYRTFIDATSDLVFLKDESFRHLFINEAYRAFLGKPQGAVIGATDFELMPQEAAEHCRASDQEALDKGTCVISEETMGPNIYQTVKFPVPLPGERMGVGGYIRDITAQKRAEARLRFHAQLLDGVRESVVATDMEGRILYWSRGAEKLYGYTAEEVTNTSYRSIAGPIEPPDEEAFRRNLVVNGSWSGEHIQKKRSGETFWTSSFISLVTDEHDRPVGFIGIDREITQQKQVETALRQSEVELRGILDTTADGILAIDSRGKVIKANQRFSDIWHIPKAILDSGDDHVLLNYVLNQLSTPDAFLEKVKALYGTTDVDLDTLAFKDGRIIERYSAPLLMEGSLIGRVWSFRDITEQKQAEKKLRDSETRFRSLFEASADGILIADVETKHFLYANPAACRMLGYTEEAWPAMTLADIHPQAALAHILAEFEAQARGEKELAPNIPCVRKDGSVFYADVNTSSFLIQGRLCNVGFFRDITDRKQAEEALRLQQSCLSAIVENQPGLIWLKDQDSRFLSVNAEFAKACGLEDPALLVGKTDLDIWPRELALKYIADDVRVMKSGKPCIVEEPISEQGKIIWFETFKTPIIDKQGLVIGTTGYSRDITERKRAEDALRESEAQNRALIHAIPDLIFTNRRDGKYLTIHAADPRLLAAPPEAVLHHGIHEILPKAIADQCLKAIANALDSDTTQEFNYSLLLGGQERHFEARVAPCTQDTVITIVRDITERKQAETDKTKLEADLQQAQKMESIGRLAGGVAHDFNNMLTVILGRVELVLDQIDPAQPIHADLEEIRNAAARSANLTRQLLAFARKQTVAPKILDLNETVAGTIQMLKRLIGENIALAWQPAGHLWPVKVDPSQIDQILANLCVNARDAIAGVGQIAIETGNTTFDTAYCNDHAGFAPGEFAWLSVSDNGCGMDRKTLDHIFEPFFTTKGIGRGIGLGLATVYGIVKQNNGFIHAYSEPGQGTTFHIYLPRHVGKEEQRQKEGPAMPAIRGHETLLLVEDEPSILKLTARMIAQQGYAVLAANTPGEAIRLAREHAGEIHLLMTDVVMPEMNGRDLAKNLLSLYPQLKRLFMSGYPAEVIAHQGILEEGVHFIQKPFSQQELADQIRKALDS